MTSQESPSGTSTSPDDRRRASRRRSRTVSPTKPRCRRRNGSWRGGGTRQGDQGPESAPGVIEEYEIARALGKMIVPIASTSGAAAEIWARLAADGSSGPTRLPDELFRRLGLTDATVEETCAAVAVAIDSVGVLQEARVRGHCPGGQPSRPSCRVPERTRSTCSPQPSGPAWGQA